jgi:hypothetical protein
VFDHLGHFGFSSHLRPRSCLDSGFLWRVEVSKAPPDSLRVAVVGRVVVIVIVIVFAAVVFVVVFLLGWLVPKEDIVSY